MGVWGQRWARADDLEVSGPRRLVRALPTWFGRSLFAPVELPELVTT